MDFWRPRSKNAGEGWLVRLFKKRQPDPADPETRRQRDVAAADDDRSADFKQRFSSCHTDGFWRARE